MGLVFSVILLALTTLSQSLQSLPFLCRKPVCVMQSNLPYLLSVPSILLHVIPLLKM